MGRTVLLFALTSAAVGCGEDVISAVDPPVGFYMPRSNCVTREGGGSACPTGAQFSFERATDHLPFELTKPTHQTNRRIACQQTYCGTGAFAYHARYRWRAGTPPRDAERYYGIDYDFPQPVDMRGKTLTAQIFVEKFDVNLNAQLAVITQPGRYRIIFDGPIYRRGGGWNTISGVVSPDNPKSDLTTGDSHVVSQLALAVYLSTEVRTGDNENWESEIYFDEIGWR